MVDDTETLWTLWTLSDRYAPDLFPTGHRRRLKNKAKYRQQIANTNTVEYR